MEPKVNQMIEDAQRGDRPAAAGLIEHHYERVYAFLRRLAGNDADAADLTQRTFRRVWQALASFQGRSSLSSWIHGIARHVYLDWRRENHRTEARSDAWWANCYSSEEGPDEVASRSDTAVAAYAAVDELEPDLRDTVHLHYYQGLTLQETADALDIAPSTVKYRLRRALEQLQRKLGSAPRTAQPISPGRRI